jgi:DNA-binding YbaB/EbfC family protein
MNPQYQKMLRQVQDMQKAMAKAQEELALETVEASAGGGTVTVVVTGALEVREVRIDPAAVDPDDVEMLQDLVTAATNEALRAAQALAQQKLGGATAGVDPAQHPRLVLGRAVRPSQSTPSRPRSDIEPEGGSGYPLHSGCFCSAIAVGRWREAQERDCPEGAGFARIACWRLSRIWPTARQEL